MFGKFGNAKSSLKVFASFHSFHTIVYGFTFTYVSCASKATATYIHSEACGLFLIAIVPLYSYCNHIACSVAIVLLDTQLDSFL